MFLLFDMFDAPRPVVEVNLIIKSRQAWSLPASRQRKDLCVLLFFNIILFIQNVGLQFLFENEFLICRLECPKFGHPVLSSEF